MTSFPTALHQRIQALARLHPEAADLAFHADRHARLSGGELDFRAPWLAGASASGRCARRSARGRVRRAFV